MGRFVNPDNSAFQVALNSPIYVDKPDCWNIQTAYLIQQKLISVTADHAGLENHMLQICWPLITVRAVILKKCFRGWI